MSINGLKEFIGNYPNFPQEGIVFRDVMPILRRPNLFSTVIDNMSSENISEKADAILAIDARGFIFGSAIALKLSKPLVTARKPGKLPGKLISGSYQLEYGENNLSVQKDSLRDFKSFVIVDDLLATGGTVKCVANILYSEDKYITGLNTVIELSSLKARSRFNFPVISQISY